MSTVRITGTLLAPAHTATGTDGSAWVSLQIGQAGTGHPACRVQHSYGIGAAAQFAAANAARRLQRGARITVHAAAWRIHPQPQPHLVLTGVDLIEQHGMPAPHHQTTEEAA